MDHCIWGAQVTPEMRIDDAEFEENEVYAIDIVVRVPPGLPDVQSFANVGTMSDALV